MTMEKVALTIPAEVLRIAKKRVRAGRAKSLSAFVSAALQEKLERDELTEILDRMDAELGAPTKGDRAWAKRVLGRSS
jgi:Arc/MetJ-type ribon-helix-helix transcriptional regulator